MGSIFWIVIHSAIVLVHGRFYSQPTFVLAIKKRKTNMRRQEVNQALKVYADGCIPSKSYVNGGIGAVQRVCDELRTQSGIIDRSYVGGSVGKRTAAVKNPDFDVVVFVNNFEPPFSLVLDYFKQILKSSNVLPGLRVVAKTEFSLKLHFLGYDIDLLPAANYSSESGRQAKSPVRDARQALEVLKKIQSNPSENYYAYSSSLEETQLRFPREQYDRMDDPSALRRLVRLCKAWNTKIPEMGYISGQSTLIELIAIHVAQQEGSQSLVRGFERFLRLMANFQNLAIEFDFDPLEPIRGETSWRPSVPRNVKRRPYVVEPANPFNNMAEGVGSDQVAKFQRAANVTLKRLISLNSQFGGVIRVEKLFVQS